MACTFERQCVHERGACASMWVPCQQQWPTRRCCCAKHCAACSPTRLPSGSLCRRPRPRPAPSPPPAPARRRAPVPPRPLTPAQGNQLCATPFGVDVVGITEVVALIGALVGGVTARKRKDEVERLNEQLRSINLSLRQQARAGTVYAPGALLLRGCVHACALWRWRAGWGRARRRPAVGLRCGHWMNRSPRRRVQACGSLAASAPCACRALRRRGRF